MAQSEVQAKRGLFSFLRRLVGSERAIVVDLLTYDNPPVVFEPNDLITRSYADGAGGALALSTQPITPATYGRITYPAPTGYSYARVNVDVKDGGGTTIDIPANDRIVARSPIDNSVVIDSQGEECVITWY